MEFIENLTNFLSSGSTRRINDPISDCNSIVQRIITNLRNSIEEHPNENMEKRALLNRRKFLFRKLDEHIANHSKIVEREKSEIISRDDIVKLLSISSSTQLR